MDFHILLCVCVCVAVVGRNYLFGFVGNEGAVILMSTFLNHINYGVHNISLSINFLIMC